METEEYTVKRLAGWLLLASLLLSLSRPGMAGQGPVEVLQTMTDTLINIVEQDPGVVHDMARLRAIAHEVVLSRVDFDAMSRWVLGKYWRTATPPQRAAFIVEFREMLLGTYLRSVSSHRGQGARYLPLRGDLQKGRTIVHVEVDQPDGPVVHVMFRMRRAGDTWLIYDVAVEGISLVATHRAGFSREIHKSGMDSLIARLHAKNVSRVEEERVAGLEPAGE
ncbi:MAG: ABC transporter substrate-binding protein [Pseudomonadota bacterium]